ncbi:MAG: hypothetical protein KOO63_03630 [Bacteroidales bacterium]|nr:hypothetical protein [Candidatus Latescibacterota bacterium]
MGPVVLFDKSFLQSLNIDEAVWFDHFFYPNIAPVFFIEALADLEKTVKSGSTPEAAVGALARKTPQVSGNPNAYHIHLCEGELNKSPVEMSGRVIIRGGTAVSSGNQTGVIHEEPPEAIAFSRWHQGEFLQAERLAAKAWRKHLASIDLVSIQDAIRTIAPVPEQIRDLETAKANADAFVSDPQHVGDCLTLVNRFIGVPAPVCVAAGQRWRHLGRIPFSVTAPYTAFVLSVLVFFYFCTAASLISKERVSNVVDMAYLFYLPFATIFTSSDKLHRRCAPLFLREDQEFLWGYDFKKGLDQVDQYFDKFPDDVKAKGISAFASRPPKESSFLISDLWDRHCGDWRNTRSPMDRMTPDHEAQIVEQVTRWNKAQVLEDQSSSEEYGTEIFKHRVDRKRGKWWQVPAEELD